VLADLQLGVVEAERLDLPAEVLDGASRDSLEAVGGEGSLDLGELAYDVVGRWYRPAVGPVAPVRWIRVRRSRSAIAPKRRR